MAYLALARKWRPTSLKDVVGQSAILTMMTNSLNQDKLHHAYLFSGSAGVGKTTSARIFAKCLNCVEGVSATPCEKCAHCQLMNSGRFPDLIEIDAASRTKVEDTRELLDNVQYAPSMGRYKVYLIDEVHMLSGHSFNALLKTLEEPPAHVKFLLATTDPQKLPPTVLSRCLKLHLNKLSVTQITSHLAHILTAENILFEERGLHEIARAAQGSMRDALSLLDQAIVFCGSAGICYEPCCDMLGTGANHYCTALLTAISAQNASQAMAVVKEMEVKGCAFNAMTDLLLELLYELALYKTDPTLLVTDPYRDASFAELAAAFSPEDIQLLYQITLKNKQDIPLAPSLRIGFEILVLRLLCFYPLSKNLDKKISPTPIEAKNHTPSLSKTSATQDWTWEALLPKLNLSGVTQMLAKQSSVGKISKNELQLCVSAKHQALCTDKQKQLLTSAIQEATGETVVVTFMIGDHTTQTPYEREQKKIATMKQTVTDRSHKDPNIQAMMALFDATITDTVINHNEEQ